MGILNDKIEELDRLEEQYNQERNKVVQAIENAVRGVGQNPAIKPVNHNSFLINLSEVLTSPWAPEFHDWNIQAERLLTLLKKKPVNQWIPFINGLLSEKAKGGWQGIVVDKVQLSRKFLLKVKEQL